MKSNRFLMGALSMVLALSSCTNSDSVPGEGDVVEGLPTVAKIVLRQESGTRAASEGATAEESKINTATVYVFANGSLATIAPLTVTGSTASAIFPTTTGPKQLFATANIPADSLKGIKVGDRLEDVRKQLLNVTAMADLATADNFWMTNAVEAPLMMVKAGGESVNDFKVEIGRACAKVNLTLSNVATHTNGTLSNIEYRVRNNPKRLHTFPVFAGEQLQAPYFALDWSATGGDTGTGGLGASVDAGSYFGNGDAGPTFTALDSPSYMMENSNLLVTKGKATYLSVKGTWKPNEKAKFKKADGVDAGLTDMPTNGDFWRIATIDPNDNTKIAGYVNEYIYVEEPAAGQIGSGQKAVKYEGGACYYDLFVADNRLNIAALKYTVARNSYFYVTIKDISGPGDAGEDDTNQPETPVESDTKMTATIEILKWRVINQDADI